MKTFGLLTAAASALIAAVLPACDGAALQDIKPGLTTAGEVRARLGEPGNEYRNADGSFTWEYNRQPHGSTCHMITFGSDQRVLRVENALAESNLARLREGMSREEVRRLLGKPASVTPFERMNEEVWDWRIAGLLPGDEVHFHAHFDLRNGLLSKTSRRQVQRG